MTKSKTNPIELDIDKEHRIRVQFDIHYKGTKGRKINGKSMTVPDMSITVRQMLERHTRGLPIPKGREPMYFDLEVPVFHDLTDVDAFKERMQSQMKVVQDFIDKDVEKMESILKKKMDDGTITEEELSKANKKMQGYWDSLLRAQQRTRKSAQQRMKEVESNPGQTRIPDAE